MLAESESESVSSKLDEPTIDVSGREARTWSFRVCVRLKDGQTFSNFLDSRKKPLETSLASALVISWAPANAAQIQSQYLNGVHIEGFVHASTHIRLGSLRRVLPEKHITDAGEIMEAAFEEVKPGPCMDYRGHSTIEKFLEETSLDPLALDKRMRVDYRGSTASNSELTNHAKTWFGRGTMSCLDLSQVETIFRSEHVAHRQETTLGLAEVITFAYGRGPESAASSTVQVEVLVHSSKPNSV
ncbi:MAG: hypothetical protein WCH11_06705 [Bdellovibrio sp.]